MCKTDTKDLFKKKKKKLFPYAPKNEPDTQQHLQKPLLDTANKNKKLVSSAQSAFRHQGLLRVDLPKTLCEQNSLHPWFKLPPIQPKTVDPIHRSPSSLHVPFERLELVIGDGCHLQTLADLGQHATLPMAKLRCCCTSEAIF